MKIPTSSLALFLSLNLLFFSLITACDDHTSPPTPKPSPKPSPTPPNSYYPSPPKPTPSPPLPYPSPPKAYPSPPKSSPSPPLPYPSPPKAYPSPPNPTPSPPKSSPSPPLSYPSPPKAYPSPPKAETCPIDALKLGVCANVLGGLLGVKVGIITPPKEKCCTLINGLVDLEAAVCLCTAIKANVLGIRLDVPISLSLLLNVCDKRIPPGYQCA